MFKYRFLAVCLCAVSMLFGSNTQPFSYQNSIPEDPIKHRVFKFTTPEEDKVNAFLKNPFDEATNKEMTDITNSTSKEVFADPKSPNYVGHNYAQPYFQEFLKKAAKIRNIDPKNIDLYKLVNEKKIDNIACCAANSMWCRPYTHKYSNNHNLDIFLHELNHYNQHDSRNQSEFIHNKSRKLVAKCAVERFPHIIKSLEDFRKYIETQADTSAAAYAGSSDVIRDVSLYHANKGSLLVDDKGYLTRKGFEILADQAREQEKKMGVDKLQEMIKQEKSEYKYPVPEHFHGVDPELAKLSLEKLNQEQKEFNAYKKERASEYEKAKNFEDIKNHKIDMLLAEHRDLQLQNAALKKEENSWWNVFSGGDTARKKLRTIETQLHHLDRDLKEQAYENARIYGSEFKNDADKDQSFHYLKAHGIIAQDRLIDELNPTCSESRKHAINADWVNREINKARLERDDTNIARLEKIKANYVEQAKEAGVVVE